MINVSTAHSDELYIFDHNSWTQPARASCPILKWIGGYLCFAFLSGISLNGIIIYILVHKRSRRSPIDVFIIALSVADLVGSLLGIPLPLTSNLACRWGFLIHHIEIQWMKTFLTGGYTESTFATTKVLLPTLSEWLDCTFSQLSQWIGNPLTIIDRLS